MEIKEFSILKITVYFILIRNFKMKFGGLNDSYSANEKCNCVNSNSVQCMCPPIDSHLNVSDLRSISICYRHLIWITKEGQGFAYGSNKSGEILGTHNKEIIKEDQAIQLTDKNGFPCKLISAVCGQSYTLYLFSSASAKNNQLAYAHSDYQSGTPVFVSINGRNHYIFLVVVLQQQ